MNNIVLSGEFAMTSIKPEKTLFKEVILVSIA